MVWELLAPAMWVWISVPVIMVMFVDSDDLLEADAVRYSVEQALVGDYDLVIFGKHYIDEYGRASRTSIVDRDIAAIADASGYYTALSYLLRVDLP